MAHFAQIDDNNIVLNVLVVSDENAPDPFPEGETAGQQFLESLGFTGTWLQTSYHGNFRKNYAGIGYTYDPERDAFIPPKPSDDCIFNEETCQWQCPEEPVE